MTFLTLTDSVKTIEFAVYDSEMFPVSHPLNGKKIQISENYGLIKALHFYDFPSPSIFSSEISECNLLGLSNPLVGYQNLTWLEVNDFQVDDELHIYTRSSNMFIESWYNKEEKIILRYTERVDYPDSIVYHYLQKREYLNQNLGQSYNTYSEGILKSVVTPRSDFDKLPGEPTVEEHYAFYYNMLADSPQSKGKSEEDGFLKEDDLCWSRIRTCGECSYMGGNYIKGLGGPYYSCSERFTTYKRELVYYKKGDVTYGTPFTSLNMSEEKKSPSVTVYPNPAKGGTITVLIEDSPYSDFTINIMDVTERVVKTEKLHSASSVLHLSDLKSGIYFYDLSSGRQRIKSDKLILLD